MASEPAAETYAPTVERQRVQRLLQLGLGGAVVLMGAGLALKLASGALTAPSVGMFEVFDRGLDTGDRLMALGILVLALTPAFRVLTLLFLWTRERDWRFAAVALAVVATLAVAIALGGG